VDSKCNLFLFPRMVQALTDSTESIELKH